MTELDKQIIKTTLRTLTELTYSNMYKLEEHKEKGEEHLKVLKGFESSLLKMIDDELFV